MSASETRNSGAGGGFWSRLFKGPPPREEAVAMMPVMNEPSPDFDTPSAATSLSATDELPMALPVELPVPPPPLIHCQVCGAARQGLAEHCGDCGWLYPTPGGATPMAGALPAGNQLAGKYEVLAPLAARPGVERYRARLLDDLATEVILYRALPAAVKPEGFDAQHALEDAIDRGGSTVVMGHELPHASTTWPSLEWETSLLRLAEDHGLPRLLDVFEAEGYDYLVHEAAVGLPFWDAWDNTQTGVQEQYTWLLDLARTLVALHEQGAIVESLRPDLFRLGLDGKPRFIELAELLPLPLPERVNLQATSYTAPELIFEPHRTDARADLYGFGALLTALLLGRELTEIDFEMTGVPKNFIERFPDAHPLLTRLLLKTFVREATSRFPTEEAFLDDATGFSELIATLEHLRQELGRVRIELAAWTSTGLVRSGNEDACAVYHSTSSHQDALSDQALVLLTDGMGGCEAGEVASGLAIEALRSELLSQLPFSGIVTGTQGAAVPDEEVKQLLGQAMSAANQAVYQAARAPGSPHRGMGCTAEAGFLLSDKLFIAHVGDSRAYLYRHGQIQQITRDQTLVARLVELGQLTEEEAHYHPRRNELQQALGGHTSVEPQLVQAAVQPGDWVLFCSDGLTGMLDDEAIGHVLQRSPSADTAARRLVNVANARGGTDNTTVVVLRLS